MRYNYIQDGANIQRNKYHWGHPKNHWDSKWVPQEPQISTTETPNHYHRNPKWVPHRNSKSLPQEFYMSTTGVPNEYHRNPKTMCYNLLMSLVILHTIPSSAWLFYILNKEVGPSIRKLIPFYVLQLNSLLEAWISFLKKENET